jgi:hypothetical protein
MSSIELYKRMEQSRKIGRKMPHGRTEHEKCGSEQSALSVITAFDRCNRLPARVQDFTTPNLE